jgi:hypothetical protein
MQAVSPDTEAVLSVLPPLSPSIVLSFDKVGITFGQEAPAGPGFT